MHDYANYYVNSKFLTCCSQIIYLWLTAPATEYYVLKSFSKYSTFVAHNNTGKFIVVHSQVPTTFWCIPPRSTCCVISRIIRMRRRRRILCLERVIGIWLTPGVSVISRKYIICWYIYTYIIFLNWCLVLDLYKIVQAAKWY